MGQTVTNIILPLFGIMLVGFFAGYLRLLDKEGSAFLSRFVFIVALPALIFVKLRDVPIGEFFDWSFLAVVGGGMLIVLCLALGVARFAYFHSLTDQGLHGLTAMFSSTGYIGLPLLLVTFGDVAVVPAVIGAMITGALFLPIGILLAEIDRTGQRERLSQTLLIRVLGNPILIAAAVGLLASWLDAPIPYPVVSLCEHLGAAFVPCALFSAGLFISGGIERTNKGEVAWLVCAKLALHPLITWWLAYHVFVLDEKLAAIAVLQAALPSGVPVFVLAQHYRSFEARSNAAIVVSTAISVFTLSVLLVYLKP